MGGTTSMLYSGAVDAATGMAVSGAVSSVASNYERQEELDVILFRLQQEVIKIQCAINAARARRIRDPTLLDWLALLINAETFGKFYQHTFKRRNSHLPMIESEGMSNLPISTFCRRYKRQRTIKSLIFGDNELKELHNVVQKLSSINICAFMAMVNAHPERPVRTYIYMEPRRLLNRDKEIDYIVKFLLEANGTGANNVDVLPIIGDDGVGKTSLVFHCFEKPIVQNHFSIKIFSSFCWHIDDPKFFRVILMRCCTSYYDVIHKDKNTLIAMLKQKLNSERFLLVLDDVWNICPILWNVLLECLRCGKQGSKVIFIMRTEDYNTRCPNSVKAETLEPLVLDWFLEEEYSLYFKEHAFGSADPDDFPELIQIGRQIEKKMKRSTWGAKILGEILRNNLNARFWSMFLEEGLSDSDFRYEQLLSVGNIMCRLLTKLLDVRNAIMPRSKKWDEKHQSYEYKSFGELIALGATHWTPINIEDESEDSSLPFLVTKYFEGDEYFALVGHCKLTHNGTKIQPILSRCDFFLNSSLLYG